MIALYRCGPPVSRYYLSIIPYRAPDMTDTKARRGAGRPRVFTTDAALDKAVRLFWQRGSEATSLAQLVADTGAAAARLFAAFATKDRKTVVSGDRVSVSVEFRGRPT